jgi:HipA-like C-terminal domain
MTNQSIIENNKFPVFVVLPEYAEEPEVIGTKEKFWFLHPNQDRCLFKKVRTQLHTGEDWSEKIVAELCELLGIPHANYELAIFNGERGIISPSFVPDGGNIIHGNEVLIGINSEYPGQANSPSHHTLNNILNAFQRSAVRPPLNWQVIDGIEEAIDVFIGYLLLDAWIGNSDRHHENWAFINLDGKVYLAPTYDHASSLGRNESDQKRRARLDTKDTGFSIAAYTNKCKSCLYARIDDTKPLTPFEAFCQAAAFNRRAAKAWLDRLRRISQDDTQRLFEQVGDRISLTGIDFAQNLLEINQEKLLSYRKQIL